MKKNFLTLSVCLSVLTLMSTSCKDDEKEDEPVNNQEVTNEDTAKAVVEDTAKVVEEKEIIKTVKHPTKEELQKNNYTAAGKYFDFKNMKAYSVDFNDENKYTFVSDVTFNEENSTLTFEDEYSTYNYVLYFVGEELYRRTGIFKSADDKKDGSLYGKYTGEDRSTGETVSINITEDGKFSDTQSYVIDGYKIIVDGFYDYYYDGKDIVTLRNYFTATEAAAPTIDGTAE